MHNKKNKSLRLPKCRFVFLDEVGISLDPNQKYFGVGGLSIANTIDLNRKLHDIFTGAVSFLGQKEERFEFKFKYITKNSFKFYKLILQTLQNTTDWDFKIVLEKKEKIWQKITFWQEYLNAVILLLKKFSKNDLILVADFLAKPKKEKIDIFEIQKQNTSIINILQLESQGSLLLQITDILLGAVAYQKRAKSRKAIDNLKLEISNLALQILENKKTE